MVGVTRGLGRRVSSPRMVLALSSTSQYIISKMHIAHKHKFFMYGAFERRLVLLSAASGAASCLPAMEVAAMAVF